MKMFFNFFLSISFIDLIQAMMMERFWTKPPIMIDA